MLDGDGGAVLVDLPDSCGQARPPRIGGYTPDLFCQPCGRYETLIGEAKTAHDLERNHTEQQLDAFLRYCALFEFSLMVMAVPWDNVPLARWLLRDAQRRCGAEHVATHVMKMLVV
jgi:hypothetical protein